MRVRRSINRRQKELTREVPTEIHPSKDQKDSLVEITAKTEGQSGQTEGQTEE